MKANKKKLHIHAPINLRLKKRATSLHKRIYPTPPSRSKFPSLQDDQTAPQNAPHSPHNLLALTHSQLQTPVSSLIRRPLTPHHRNYLITASLTTQQTCLSPMTINTTTEHMYGSLMVHGTPFNTCINISPQSHLLHPFQPQLFRNRKYHHHTIRGYSSASRHSALFACPHANALRQTFPHMASLFSVCPNIPVEVPVGVLSNVVVDNIVLHVPKRACFGLIREFDESYDFNKHNRTPGTSLWPVSFSLPELFTPSAPQRLDETLQTIPSLVVCGTYNGKQCTLHLRLNPDIIPDMYLKNVSYYSVNVCTELLRSAQFEAMFYADVLPPVELGVKKRRNGVIECVNATIATPLRIFPLVGLLLPPSLSSQAVVEHCNLHNHQIVFNLMKSFLFHEAQRASHHTKIPLSSFSLINLKGLRTFRKFAQQCPPHYTLDVFYSPTPLATMGDTILPSILHALGEIMKEFSHFTLDNLLNLKHIYSYTEHLLDGAPLDLYNVGEIAHFTIPERSPDDKMLSFTTYVCLHTPPAQPGDMPIFTPLFEVLNDFSFASKDCNSSNNNSNETPSDEIHRPIRKDNAKATLLSSHIPITKPVANHPSLLSTFHEFQEFFSSSRPNDFSGRPLSFATLQNLVSKTIAHHICTPRFLESLAIAFPAALPPHLFHPSRAEILSSALQCPDSTILDPSFRLTLRISDCDIVELGETEATFTLEVIIVTDGRWVVDTTRSYTLSNHDNADNNEAHFLAIATPIRRLGSFHARLTVPLQPHSDPALNRMLDRVRLLRSSAQHFEDAKRQKYHGSLLGHPPLATEEEPVMLTLLAKDAFVESHPFIPTPTPKHPLLQVPKIMGKDNDENTSELLVPISPTLPVKIHALFHNRLQTHYGINPAALDEPLQLVPLSPHIRSAWQRLLLSAMGYRDVESVQSTEELTTLYSNYFYTRRFSNINPMMDFMVRVVFDLSQTHLPFFGPQTDVTFSEIVNAEDIANTNLTLQEHTKVVFCHCPFSGSVRKYTMNTTYAGPLRNSIPIVTALHFTQSIYSYVKHSTTLADLVDNPSKLQFYKHFIEGTLSGSSKVLIEELSKPILSSPPHKMTPLKKLYSDNDQHNEDDSNVDINELLLTLHDRGNSPLTPLKSRASHETPQVIAPPRSLFLFDNPYSLLVVIGELLTDYETLHQNPMVSTGGELQKVTTTLIGQPLSEVDHQNGNKSNTFDSILHSLLAYSFSLFSHIDPAVKYESLDLFHTPLIPPPSTSSSPISSSSTDQETHAIAWENAIDNLMYIRNVIPFTLLRHAIVDYCRTHDIANVQTVKGKSRLRGGESHEKLPKDVKTQNQEHDHDLYSDSDDDHNDDTTKKSVSCKIELSSLLIPVSALAKLYKFPFEKVIPHLHSLRRRFCGDYEYSDIFPYHIGINDIAFLEDLATRRSTGIQFRDYIRAHGDLAELLPYTILEMIPSFQKHPHLLGTSVSLHVARDFVDMGQTYIGDEEKNILPHKKNNNHINDNVGPINSAAVSALTQPLESSIPLIHKVINSNCADLIGGFHLEQIEANITLKNLKNNPQLGRRNQRDELTKANDIIPTGLISRPALCPIPTYIAAKAKLNLEKRLLTNPPPPRTKKPEIQKPLSNSRFLMHQYRQQLAARALEEDEERVRAILSYIAPNTATVREPLRVKTIVPVGSTLLLQQPLFSLTPTYKRSQGPFVFNKNNKDEQSYEQNLLFSDDRNSGESPSQHEMLSDLSPNKTNQALSGDSPPSQMSHVMGVVSYSMLRRNITYADILESVICENSNAVFTNLLQSLRLPVSKQNALLSRLVVFNSFEVEDIYELLDLLNHFNAEKRDNLINSQTKYLYDNASSRVHLYVNNHTDDEDDNDSKISIKKMSETARKNSLYFDLPRFTGLTTLIPKH